MPPALIAFSDLLGGVPLDRERATRVRVRWPPVLHQHDLPLPGAFRVCPEDAKVSVEDLGFHRPPHGLRHEHLLVEGTGSLRVDPTLRLDGLAVSEIAGRSL